MSLLEEKIEETLKFLPKLLNGVEYALTINPSEQYPLSSSRYLLVYDSMIKFIKHSKLCKFATLKLITEVSFPMNNTTSKGHPAKVLSRIHYHGTITFQDVVSFYIVTQPRLAQFAVYEIDTIDEESGRWARYLAKDFVNWLETPETPFTEYEINNQSVKQRKERVKDISPYDIGLRPIEQHQPEESIIASWSVKK